MFLAALFLTVKNMETKMLNECIKKQCICTNEYYSALKKNKALIQNTTWMNLEKIMVNEIKLSQCMSKTTQYMIPFI